MATIATFDDLRRFAKDIDSRALLLEASTRKRQDVFLSHSSSDNHLLPGVIRLLQGHGASVYVDKADGRLPQIPSQETAQVLRATIADCPRFVLFVTSESKESIWIPWELGLADGGRGWRNVALMPAAAASYEEAWTEQEYLGLYLRIVWGRLGDEPKERWFVLNLHGNHGKSLDSWIRWGW